MVLNETAILSISKVVELFVYSYSIDSVEFCHTLS
jgi:hypothetical protein